MVFTRWNKFRSFTEKKIFCLFHAFNTLWEKLYQNPVHFFSLIPRGVIPPPCRHSNALHYYVECEKCKVNDVIFPSGFEARAINLGNKNMKICIFTGATSVRSKNIFTDISRYPTGKHEIKLIISVMLLEKGISCICKKCWLRSACAVRAGWPGSKLFPVS